MKYKPARSGQWAKKGDRIDSAKKGLWGWRGGPEAGGGVTGQRMQVVAAASALVVMMCSVLHAVLVVERTTQGN
jgi:hypothetical protein